MTQKYKKFLIKTTKTITKLIHSHNTMKVFFSGTDMAELEDNSPSHNFYLSLIVNNAMDFTAKVSFIATAEIRQEAEYKALDENGNEYIIDNAVLKAKKEKLFIYDCTIQSNLDNVIPDNFFLRNIQEVLQEADKPKFTPAKTTPAIGNPIPGNVKPFQTQPAKSGPTMGGFKEIDWDDYDTPYDGGINPDIEIFATHLLNGTNPPDEETTFEDLLLQFKMLKVSGTDIATSALENIFSLYEKFYEEQSSDEDVFVDVVEEVAEFLETYEDKYRFLTPTIMGLKLMVKELLKQ